MPVEPVLIIAIVEGFFRMLCSRQTHISVTFIVTLILFVDVSLVCENKK